MYKLGEKVSFKIQDKIISGTIHIIDKHGTFEYPDETCYDVLGYDNCLYKHISEHMIIS